MSDQPAPAADLPALLNGDGPVLFAFAHPDDETLSAGVLMADLAARGTRVQLVTATRGECGEVVPGPLHHLEGTDQLPSHREGELAAALRALGARDHVFLGQPPARAAGLSPRRYRDSGMRWIRPGLAGPAETMADDALCAAPPAQAAADVAALLAAWRPVLVVGDDAGGGYGHPDHVRIRDAALAATREHGIPFAELAPQRGAGVTWFDGEHRLAQVVRALSAHASQVTVDGRDVIHSGGQRTPIVTALGLRLVP